MTSTEQLKLNIIHEDAFYFITERNSGHEKLLLVVKWKVFQL